LADTKEALIKIVGRNNFVDDSSTLEDYSKDQSFAEPRKPRAIVKPANANEVQEIIKWANQTRTPLVPLSSGSPHFRGDTVPSVGGAIIVDLGRMKRIIRADRRSRMIMIEPGVTFDQLEPELARKGLRLSMPLLPRANKSVIASFLEREPITVPKYQWVLLDPLRCLEVIWGDGSKMWTGEAGEQRVNLEEQWKRGIAQIIPLGPGQIDYYRLVSSAQGSMGIVTWASLRCEVLPEFHKLLFIPAENLEDLINCAYRILRIRLGDEFLILNRTDLAYALGTDADQISEIKAKLPPWAIIVGIAGRDVFPEERVKYQKKDITDIAQQFGLKPYSEIGGVRGGEMLDKILNPSTEPYWKLGYKGGFQDIFFLTTLNKIPEYVRTMYSAAEALDYAASDIGIYLQPLHQGVSCHCEFTLPYAPNNGQVAKVKALLGRASEALINQGAFFSRPYGMWADMALNRDAQHTMLLKKVKEIFDPNNVLNPGKLCF
jgi:hypothetical protein